MSSVRFGIMLVYAVHFIPTLRLFDNVTHLLSEWIKGQMEGGIEGEMEEGPMGWPSDVAVISLRRHLQSITNGSTNRMWSQVNMAPFNTSGSPRLPHGSCPVVLEAQRGRFHTLRALTTRLCTLFTVRGLLARTVPIPHSFITYFPDQTVNQPENA